MYYTCFKELYIIAHVTYLIEFEFFLLLLSQLPFTLLYPLLYPKQGGGIK